MPRKSLRAVSEEERQVDPPTLLEAVESGDVLDMLLAQRRLIAEALTSAGESTRPQLNNELNKLHALILAEQERRATANEHAGNRARVASDAKFDASAL